MAKNSDSKRETRLNTVEKVLLLQDLEIFRFASTEHLSLLAAMVREREFPAGSVLFGKGDPSHELCLLVRGRAELDPIAGSSEQVERVALDFLSFFSDKPHAFNATAIEPCTLLCVPYEELVDYMTSEAEFCWAVLRYVSRLTRRRIFADQIMAREDLDEAGVDQTLDATW